MNFVKIIQNLNDLEQKHQHIRRKFSSHSKARYVYKTCLREDEADDLRIYGHTHADTISKFKRRYRQNSNQPNSDKFISLQQSFYDNSGTNPDRFQRRAKTAHKAPVTNRKKNQVMEIYEKGNNFYGGQLERPHTVHLSTRKEHVIKKNQEIRRKSIINFKKQFSAHFIEDLRTAKVVTADRKIRQVAKSICFSANETLPKKKQLTNIFSLTQKPIQSPPSPPTLPQIQLSCRQSQISILELLNSKIFESYQKNYIPSINQKKRKGWEIYMEKLLSIKDAEKFKYIFVATTSLNVFQVSFFMLPMLPAWLNQMFRQEKFMHLHLVRERTDGELEVLFQEFLVAPTMSVQYLEWPKQLFRYYLRRFLLLSHQKLDIEEALAEQKTFFQKYHKAPQKLFNFTHELHYKPYSIITYKMCRCQGYLNEILQKGYSQMELRRINWIAQSQRSNINKFRKPYKKSTKQIYFCICFFLSIILFLFVFFLCLCLNFLAFFYICLHFSTFLEVQFLLILCFSGQLIRPLLEALLCCGSFLFLSLFYLSVQLKYSDQGS